MSVYDFLKKEYQGAKSRGIKAVLIEGGGEFVGKVSNPIVNRKSTAIWDADWDVCVVLDACRYDLWQEVVGDNRNTTDSEFGWLDREFGSVWSVGSSSPDWISSTFANRYESEWSDTGYVTSNPFSGKDGTKLEKFDPDVFPLEDRGLAYLDEVWQDQWPMSDELPTVDPATVTERALWAWQQRDDLGLNRLIVHYMQPHVPFVTHPEWWTGWNTDGEFGFSVGNEKDDWKRVRDGELPLDGFWDAYAENLRWVLSEVERWNRTTPADVLVTSDHGNGLGEYGVWSHPRHMGTPVLRQVPWGSFKGDNSDPVSVSPPGDPPVTSSGENDLEKQLNALGYV